MSALSISSADAGPRRRDTKAAAEPLAVTGSDTGDRARPRMGQVPARDLNTAAHPLLSAAGGA